MGLAPLLAVTPFALVPAAAQAAPHYYVNGARLKAGTASTKTAIEWGNVALAGGDIGHFKVTCHTAEAGTLFNPEPLETSAGEGVIEQYAPFACEQEAFCPSGSTRIEEQAENLPWHNVLTEAVAGTIRQETTGLKIKFECFEGEKL